MQSNYRRNDGKNWLIIINGFSKYVPLLQHGPQLFFGFIEGLVFMDLQKIIVNYRMFRAIPTNNKLCFDKQLKRSWKIHEDKLRTIRSSINKCPPQHFNFLDQRAKRSALDNVRNIEIQKQNHSLLTKIKCIGEKGNNTSYVKSSSSLCDKKRTLNEGYRKKELVKIVQQNQEIIKRIHEKKSMYNVRKWEKERKNVEKNINLISSFPYKNYPTTHTRVNLWMVDQDNKSVRMQNLSLSKSRIKREDLMFSGTYKIGEAYYLIETHFYKKNFIIEIQNLEKITEKYKLQMSENQAIEMLEKNFDGQIQKLFSCLEVDQVKGTCELKCVAPQQSRVKEQKMSPTS